MVVFGRAGEDLRNCLARQPPGNVESRYSPLAECSFGWNEPMHASLATTADVASWLEIVREVEPLFGPMPDFEAMLFRNISQQAALCVRSDNKRDPVFVLGGLLLGGAPPQVWIRWLAVRSSARGIGIGRCLVEEAIKHLAASKSISVETFREENIEGRAVVLDCDLDENEHVSGTSGEPIIGN